MVISNIPSGWHDHRSVTLPGFIMYDPDIPRVSPWAFLSHPSGVIVEVEGPRRGHAGKPRVKHDVVILARD